MIRKIFLPFVALFLLASCAPAPTPIPGLTVDILRNSSYLAPVSNRAVTLVDGVAEYGSDPSAADYLQVSMSEMTAFGDLDYDGRQDAVILLAENMGGTGVFVTLLAILDRGGVPYHVASVYIDDRPLLNQVIIQSGEIILDATIHASDDPMCCPDQETQQGYRLYGNELILTRMSSETPTGLMRSIEITSPVDLEEKEYPLTLTGSVTVGPFENTLAYNVYDPVNALVTAGSIMTDSPDMGLPGNFTLTLDLTMAGVTGLVRIEIVEYSMMDGSVLTLDSVLVHVP